MCEGYCVVYEELASEDESGQSAHYHKYRQEGAVVLFHYFFFDGSGFCLACLEVIEKVDGKYGEEEYCVESVYGAFEGYQTEEYGDTEKNGDVFRFVVFRYRDRREDGGEAEYHQDVEDI